MGSAHSNPLLSVIIPNLNSPLIGRTLAALHQQEFDLDQVEVLVVGVDQTEQVCYDQLVRMIITEPFASAAKNRNVGMLAAQGDILCFTDADCIPDSSWLMRIASYFDDSQVDVLGGGVTFGKSTYWAAADHLSWFFQFLSTAQAGFRDHLPTLNLAVRRSVIRNVGVMDESFRGAAGEDTEWTERMCESGYKLHFEPSITVFHATQRQTLVDLWKHGFRYGQNTTKIRGRSTGLYRLLSIHWLLLLLLAPAIALFATLRVIINCEKDGIGLIPGIWISKIAWCVGASQSLRKREQVIR